MKNVKRNPEQLAEQIASAFDAYKKANEEYKNASRLMDTYEDEPEYVTLWNRTLDKVMDCQRECIELIYILCADRIPGFTRNDARRMFIRYDDEIMRIVSVLAR